MQRRSFIAALCAAPAIVRSESLMKIVVPKREIWHTGAMCGTDLVKYYPGCSVGKTTYEEFVNLQLRNIAQALGVPFEQMLSLELLDKPYKPASRIVVAKHF